MDTQIQVLSSVHESCTLQICKELHQFQPTLDQATWGEGVSNKPLDLLQFLL